MFLNESRNLILGATLTKLGWNEGFLLPGVGRGSMKILSTLLSGTDEAVTF